MRHREQETMGRHSLVVNQLLGELHQEQDQRPAHKAEDGLQETAGVLVALEEGWGDGCRKQMIH